MPQRLRFVVRSPAMMPPSGPGAPMPDPQPLHLGGQMVSDHVDQFLPTFGGALVHGGHKVGEKWLGCTYTTGPWVIPGLGDVEPAP